jgi:hypothetical protein
MRMDLLTSISRCSRDFHIDNFNCGEWYGFSIFTNILKVRYHPRVKRPDGSTGKLSNHVDRRYISSGIWWGKGKYSHQQRIFEHPHIDIHIILHGITDKGYIRPCVGSKVWVKYKLINHNDFTLMREA